MDYIYDSEKGFFRFGKRFRGFVAPSASPNKSLLQVCAVMAVREGVISQEMGVVLFAYIDQNDFSVISLSENAARVTFPSNIHESEKDVRQMRRQRTI